MQYLSFFKSVLVHKWYVYHYGRMIGVPRWRLFVHDLSKFHPVEFFAYAKKFYGNGYADGFAKALEHHYAKNDHHTDHWISKNLPGGIQYGDVPDTVLKEMVADWFAASRVYSGKTPRRGEWEWYENNFEKLPFAWEDMAFLKYCIENIFTQTEGENNAKR